jgi:hypothetical protein
LGFRLDSQIIENLETVLVRGERLPSWEEVALATVDSTIAVSAVGALAKGMRIGTLKVAESSVSSFFVESAYKAISRVGKIGWQVGPVALSCRWQSHGRSLLRRAPDGC